MGCKCKRRTKSKCKKRMNNKCKRRTKQSARTPMNNFNDEGL
jgi:hypothetical protein